MDRRKFLRTVAGTGAVLASPLRRTLDLRPSTLDPVYVERWSWVMGQPVSLKLFAGSEGAGLEAAQAAFAELRRVEGKLSRFDPLSDLSALNDRAGRGGLRVGEDLRAVLRLGEGIRRVTGGAFDPAIEPVMRAWGFHSARTTPPSPAELTEASDAVRAAHLRWDVEKVTLEGSGAALDLGGIGVGYGLDRAGRVLRARGIRSALLDVSGDILAIGAPPGEAGWKVDLADPTHLGATTGSVLLRDQALATSANTESVLEWRGRIVGHVMDPHTAEPAARVRQVTIVAPSGVLADAWSTARLVADVGLPSGIRTVEL